MLASVRVCGLASLTRKLVNSQTIFRFCFFVIWYLYIVICFCYLYIGTFLDFVICNLEFICNLLFVY